MSPLPVASPGSYVPSYMEPKVHQLTNLVQTLSDELAFAKAQLQRLECAELIAAAATGISMVAQDLHEAQDELAKWQRLVEYYREQEERDLVVAETIQRHLHTHSCEDDEREFAEAVYLSVVAGK